MLGEQGMAFFVLRQAASERERSGVKRCDVCLASVPYEALWLPPAGCGILLAQARRAGLDIEAVDTRFWYASRIGLECYVACAVWTPFMVADYTFSQAAFGDLDAGYEEFLAREVVRFPEMARPLQKMLGVGAQLMRGLESLRRSATEFIAEAATRVLSLSPKVVGCSSTFQQHCAALAFLRKVKQLAPSVVTVLGGANCEAEMGAATARLFPWLDVVFSGEADESFPRLCKRLLEDPDSLTSDTLPPGVFARAGNGELRIGSGVVGMCEEMDSLAIPDYAAYFEALHESPDSAKIYPALVMEMSRGCWWGARQACSFCGLNGVRSTFRSKSPTRVLSELEELAERYQLDLFITTDNILDRAYLGSVVPELARHEVPRFRIFCETTAHLDEEDVKLLASAGIRKIQPGIENLHDGVLRLLNKGTSAVQNVALLKYAMENGVSVFWNMLFGVPGSKPEWWEEMTRWLPLIAHLQAPAGVSPIRFDRFSAYHRDPARYGLKLEPFEAYGRLYPVSGRDLSNLAYFFRDVTPRAPTPPAELQRFREAVEEWRSLFARYSTPDRVLLTVKDEGGRSFVEDRRPCAVEKAIVLTGLQSTVFRACARPLTWTELERAVESVEGRAVAEANLKDAVDALAQSKLILSLSNKLLSLALREPVQPMVTNREFLGGCNIDGRLVS